MFQGFDMLDTDNNGKDGWMGPERCFASFLSRLGILYRI